MMDHKIILNKNHQSIESIEVLSMFSEHSIIKLEINNNNISKTPGVESSLFFWEIVFQVLGGCRASLIGCEKLTTWLGKDLLL